MAAGRARDVPPRVVPVVVPLDRVILETAFDLDGLAGLGIDGRRRDKGVAIGLTVIGLVRSRDTQLKPLASGGLILIDLKFEVAVHNGIVVRVLGREHGECGDDIGVVTVAIGAVTGVIAGAVIGVFDLLVCDALCPFPRSILGLCREGLLGSHEALAELDGLKRGRLRVGESAVDAHVLRDASAPVVVGVGHGVRHAVRAGVLRRSIERLFGLDALAAGVGNLNVGQACALDRHGLFRRGVDCFAFGFKRFTVVVLVVDVERERELRLGVKVVGRRFVRIDIC